MTGMLHHMSREQFLEWWAEYAVRRDQELKAEQRRRLIERAETSVANQLKRGGGR